MAILPALQSAAIRLIARRPGTFFGASGTFEMEICDLVNEVAQDVTKYQDWQALTKVGTVTGNGSVTAFDLPSDYDRMLVNTRVSDLSNWFWGFGSFTDLNDFLYSEARGFNGLPGGWIIYGGQLRFSPAPSAAQVATFPYITKNLARSASAEAKPSFDTDTDEFLLPERLLTLGLVWRWRENKKLDYTGDMEAFTKALDEYGAKDRGTQTYRRNFRGSFPGTFLAYPYELGGA